MRSKPFNKPVVMLMLVMMFVLCRGAQCLADQRPEISQLISNALEQFEGLEDYTCKLDKRVAKEGRLHEDLAIAVKYKKPGHYYFRWNRGARKGREAIYVAGRHNDKIVTHPGGILRFVTVRLDPEGPLAMKENLHALPHSGLEKIMDIIASDYRQAQKDGLDAVHLMGEDQLGGRSVWVVQGCFPDAQDYYAPRVILWIDKTLQLPIRIRIYDRWNALTEEYIFRNLKINSGLTARDFQPDNPEYDFF